MTLSVVCWLWPPAPGYRSTFGPEAVNAMRAMVARHYARPHRFICVTDQPEGIYADVEIVPAWNDFVEIPSPHGGAYPACYRRLRGFHPDIAAVFGPRFVSLDLDLVIVDDVVPLWDRPEDFVGLRDAYWQNQMNGSMWLLRSGSRPGVWTGFNPTISPIVARNMGFKGSDQAWMSYSLPDEPMWDARDGVFSYRRHIQQTGELPRGARVVSFHGKIDPWHPEAQRLDWVREHWRCV